MKIAPGTFFTKPAKEKKKQSKYKKIPTFVIASFVFSLIAFEEKKVD